MFQNLDRQGRIVIPASYRKKLQIKTGDSLMVTLMENKIVVEPDPVTAKCVICSTTGTKINWLNELKNYPGVCICHQCQFIIKESQF